MRRAFLDRLGEAFSAYRQQVYAHGFSGRTEVDPEEVASLCRRALRHIDPSIRGNRRPDGLYHAYNLLSFSAGGEEVSIQRLHAMLEGQVAALSSGLVGAEEAIRVVEALHESAMYRADQRSFLLYPERELPGFFERNEVASKRVAEVPLLVELLAEAEGSILIRDASGTHRFHPDFQNAEDLGRVLDRLGRDERWSRAVERDRDAVQELFEEVFRHRSFTGRSGTMYGYEGIGCIYWHMVAKLLLAVQELFLRAVREKEPAEVREALARAYYRIRAGLGFEKSVTEYGAFPFDPYSHTPRHAGAQQPGMTGQVKEEILTRLGELGVEVEDGRLAFRPSLLRRSELRSEAGEVSFYDADGERIPVEVPADALAFSFCQVPVVYLARSGPSSIKVVHRDGAQQEVPGLRLDPRRSRLVFERSGEIVRLEVTLPEEGFLPL